MTFFFVLSGFVLAWAGFNGDSRSFFYLAFPLVFRWLSGRTPGNRLRVTLAVVLSTSAIACVASFAGSRYDLAAYAFPGFRIGEFVLGVALRR